jgi:hypothetical protein
MYLDSPLSSPFCSSACRIFSLVVLVLHLLRSTNCFPLFFSQLKIKGIFHSNAQEKPIFRCTSILKGKWELNIAILKIMKAHIHLYFDGSTSTMEVKIEIDYT